MFDIERDYLKARRLDLPAREAAFEALLDADPSAAQAALQLAAQRADLAGMLAGGGALWRRGLLRPEDGPVYGSALLADQRFDEASVVWASVVADNRGGHSALAEALAAQGRIEEAFDPASTALTLMRHRIKLFDLARRLRSIMRVEQEPVSWFRLRLLIEYHLLVGSRIGALRHLQTLETDPPPGEPKGLDALRLVEAALALEAPRLVKPLMKGVIRNLPKDDALRTVTIQMAEQLGLAADAAERATVFLPQLSQDEGLPAQQAPARRRLRYHAAEAFASNGQLGDAIRQLGALATADHRDPTAMTALQRCCGEAVLAEIEWAWAAPRPPRIFNLLPYYKERMLFEMRLHEMGDWVDHFVVVEANLTFTGNQKPLHFAELAPRYADRGDQILPVAIEAFPDWADTAWARELYQRDSAVRGLVGRLRPDDIILITDADELVDRRALDGFWPHLATLRMMTSKHFLNYRATPGTRPANRRSGAICRGEHLAQFGSSYIRSALSTARKTWESVPAAGWHFTSLGDAESLLEKLSAYAHQEASKAQHRERNFATGLLNDIRAGSPEAGWGRTSIDDSFPRYVIENRDRLAPLILG